MANLNTAKQDAAARSQESKKTIFVNINGAGEYEIADKQTRESMFAFEGGNEVPILPIVEEKVKTKPAGAKVTKAPTKTISKSKTKKKMATETKPAPAKKAAKKATAAPAKGGDKLIGKATTVLLSKADWAKVDKAVEAGKGSIRELASKGILKVV